MNYSIITVTDTNTIVREEHITDKNQAFARFHYWCNLLFNDTATLRAIVKVMDENLDCVENKMELIVHQPVQSSEPEPVLELEPEPSEDVQSSESTPEAVEE